MCEYDSTWDTESDGDDSAGENQSRRSSQDKNKSGWSLVRSLSNYDSFNSVNAVSLLTFPVLSHLQNLTP